MLVMEELMTRYLFLTVTSILFLLLPVNTFAATYYVKPNGNDNLDGRSDATAWKTIAKVNSTVSGTGDDVYFKCDNTWTGESLGIDWAGTSGNRAIVGAYYGDATIGVSGSKPIIDGNNTAPSDEWAGLVHVLEASNYVTIENLDLRNSHGMGVRTIRADFVNIDSVEIDHCYKQGVDFYYSDDCILENSDITDTNTYGNGAMIRGYGSYRTKFRYNTLHESRGWSEAVNAILSDDMEIIGNLIYDTYACGIYLGHAIGTVVKYNIVYYSNDTTYWRNAPYNPMPGVAIADEPYLGTSHRCSNLTITNNLIAGTGGGIVMWSNPNTQCGLIDSVIANNTVVEPRGAHSALEIPSSPRHSNTIIKNNIFWQTDGTIADVHDNPDLDIDNNLWSKQPEVDARGENDIDYGVPQLAKTSGWHNLSPGSLDCRDFDLQSTSPCIDAGTPLGEQFKYSLELAQSNWPSKKIVLIDQENEGSGWEIGADIHANPSPSDPPDAPAGLTIETAK